MALLFRNCAVIIPSASRVALQDADRPTEGPAIRTIGHRLLAPADARILVAIGRFLYPGLVNTHHHFLQAFLRSRVELDWTGLSVIEWLDRICPIFAWLTGDCFCHSSLTDMAELIQHGCETASRSIPAAPASPTAITMPRVSACPRWRWRSANR